MASLSIAEKQKLCDYIRSGHKYSEIAVLLNISRCAVSGYAYRLKKYGLVTKHDEEIKKRNEIVFEISRLKKLGHNYREIAQIMGRSYTSVQKAARKYIGVYKGSYNKTHSHVEACLDNMKKMAKYNKSWNYIPKIGISLLDIKSNQCHFPCKDGLYCGGEIRENGKDPLRHYCEEHYKIMTGGKNE